MPALAQFLDLVDLLVVAIRVCVRRWQLQRVPLIVGEMLGWRKLASGLMMVGDGRSVRGWLVRGNFVPTATPKSHARLVRDLLAGAGAGLQKQEADIGVGHGRHARILASRPASASDQVRNIGALCQIVFAPQRAKVGEVVQSQNIRLGFGSIKRHDVVNVPEVPVLPRHARQKLALDVGSEFGPSAADDALGFPRLPKAALQERIAY